MCITVCLSAHTQCSVSVILSAGMAASGLEDGVGMGWEGEQYLLGARWISRMPHCSNADSLSWIKGCKTSFLFVVVFDGR